MRRFPFLVLAIGQVLLSASAGWCQDAAGSSDGVQGYVALGAGLLPDYEGASKYVVVPYFDGQANLGNYFLRFDGSFKANIIDDENFHAGPLIGYRMGRGDVYDGAIARMQHIRYSVTDGGFVEYEHLAQDPRSGERLTLSVADGNINYQSGLEVTLAAMVHRPLTFIDEGLIAAMEIDTSFGDGKFMQTSFGVSGADALASGFPVYRAGSGAELTSISLSLDQYLSPKWSVGVRMRYARLLGDAEESPVTRIAGSPDQLFGAVVVGYVL